MPSRTTALLIGATGMLGRPVARRLVSERLLDVRCLVRDLARGQRMLPPQCACVRGDLKNQGSLHRAMEGVGDVYINLATPYASSDWDPELEGTKRIVAAARKMGVRRILRLSAQGVPESAEDWWVARRKLEADEVVMESGLDFTIFRPTWFTESLALFILGPLLMSPSTPAEPLHWITGDDYASMVAAALRRPKKTANQVYTIQGPEAVPFDEAVARFSHAVERRLVTVPLPRFMIRSMGLVSSSAAYLDALIDMTFEHTTEFVGASAWKELVEPKQTIEDYAASIEETGDLPKK